MYLSTSAQSETRQAMTLKQRDRIPKRTVEVLEREHNVTFLALSVLGVVEDFKTFLLSFIFVRKETIPLHGFFYYFLSLKSTNSIYFVQYAIAHHEHGSEPWNKNFWYFAYIDV